MEPIQLDNPLLRKLPKKMPGETFRLPSRGLPYANGELSSEVTNGELVIYPMSTLDEIYMRTPDMLFQGTAVEKVFSHCVPQVIKPMRLLAKDIDYILTCLRKVTYGDNLEIEYKCSCPTAKKRTYTLKMSQFINKAKEITDDVEAKTHFELDNYYFVIKHSAYEDILKLGQKDNNNLSPEEIYESIIDGLSLGIQSVDQITDRAMIRDFLLKCDRNFQLEIATKINEINDWGVEFIGHITCKDCGKDKEVPIALNPISFFTQPSNREIKKES